MEYNTTRSQLLMPEYGRNVQKMAEFLLTIEDPERRMKNAEVVIELMGILNPHLKTIEDYKHKLWDHLHQMTDFKLQVDSPYPAPTPESVFKKPEVLPYPQQSIKLRHLGRNVEQLLERAVAETNEEKKQGLTQTIGYYMKLAYGNWHREPVHDDMIKSEMTEISHGALKYETGGYKVHFDINSNNNNNNNNRQNFKQRNNGNGNNNNNNRGFKGNANQLQGPGGNNNSNRNFNNSNAANGSSNNQGSGGFKYKKYKNKNKQQ